jgi:hypothetical protein
MRFLAPRAVLPSRIAARDWREKRDEINAACLAPFSLVSRFTRRAMACSRLFSFR